MLKEDQREEKTGCDQLHQPCAKNRMNSAAPFPAQRGAQPRPLTPPTSVNPKGTVAAAPLAECVLELSSRGIREGNVFKADMNIRSGLRERAQKECALPSNSCAVLHSCCTNHSVFLGGSLGT